MPLNYSNVQKPDRQYSRVKSKEKAKRSKSPLKNNSKIYPKNEASNYATGQDFRLDTEENSQAFDGENLVYERKSQWFDSVMKSGTEGHQEFFDANGKLHFRGQVKEGLANGVGILFFSSGVIEYKGEFQENLFHGKGSFFNENGGLVYKGDYVEGIREGIGIEYFPSGDK